MNGAEKIVAHLNSILTTVIDASSEILIAGSGSRKPWIGSPLLDEMVSGHATRTLGHFQREFMHEDT